MANDILVFADDAGANVLTQVEYAADTQRTVGNQAGIARSSFVNKVLRQTSFIAASLAQLIVDRTGQSVLDDGDDATLLTNMKNATDVAYNINSATAKTTPVDADQFGIADSAASNVLKKVTWANIKTALTGLFAPIASPAFTGTPTAPTAAVGTNTTQIATTAYVDGKMVLRTAVPSTSGTSIDFTGIPSWAKRITVMFNGISTNGSALLQIQIGAGSVTTTGYVSSCVGGTTGNVLGGSSLTSGFGLGSVGGAVNVYTGSFDIETIGSNTWIEKGIIILEATGNTYMSSGRLTLGGTLDRIRITTVNGTDTFDSGSINIMYEG